jgi:KUP system potassium uptake protein
MCIIRVGAVSSGTRSAPVWSRGWPRWAHYPPVLLATVATIIASQAVISGVFSIARRAVQLGRLPRTEIRHTSATDVGQIYVPRMNFILSVGVVLIVLIFHTSSSLAAAYGIAVSGVMVIDTCHASIVATKQWHWSIRAAIGLFGILFLIDLSFLTANSLKIVQGRWLPLGLSIDIATTTFFIGRETLVATEHPALGHWTTWLYLRLAASALSPVRFYHLPPNRVVELGSQIEM